MILAAIVGYLIDGSMLLVGGYAVWSALQDALAIGKNKL
jgi:hypothetical protein